MIERRLHPVVSGRWAPLKVAVVCWVISTFLSSPSLFMWSRESIFERSRAHDYLELAHNPLSRDIREPIVGYRILLPIVAHTLHLPAIPSLALPYLSHFGFIALLFLALRAHLEATASFLAALCVALSFAFMWSNWQPGFTDTTSHLFAASLLLTASAPWTACAVFLGLLNDERMILPLPFILLWHLVIARERVPWRVLDAIRWCVAAGLGLAGYLLVRHALTVGWIGMGIPKPFVYAEMEQLIGEFRPKLGQWVIWAANAFMAYRWTWILLPALLIVWWESRRYTLAAVFAASLCAGVLSTALVQDVGRSLGFMFPAIAIACVELNRVDRIRIRRYLPVLVAALVITPVVFTFEEFQPHWMRPLPLVLFRLWQGGAYYAE